MKLFVFGKTGQVARELILQGSAHEITALGRDQADLSDLEACAAIIAQSDADAVINAAAYTAVDKAEEEEALATIINGDTPGAMARACAAKDIPFLHVSTDYVFDGKGEAPWSPSDPVAPQNAYGRSKLAGEEAVRAAGRRRETRAPRTNRCARSCFRVVRFLCCSSTCSLRRLRSSP